MNRMSTLDPPISSKPSSKTPESVTPLVDVFISYARSDEEIARNLAETLRSEGFEVWFDTSIYAGANWRSLLLTTLSSAKAVLVLWSQNSVKRRWVLKEAKIAMTAQRLVPVCIDDCKRPARFADVQSAMMPGWRGTGPHPELERLLSGLARLAPPSRVDNVRPGYEAGFLGTEISLPAVNGLAAEFRYLHFSVVMNPARRLAWYVAYNVRTHADVKRGDQWMPDPMLPASFQPHDDDFRGRGFDRGHIAAPLTVSWGTVRQAQVANYQSFFWTNTVPQSADMNRGWWLGVELWERKLAERCMQLTGFAGPVLSEDDTIATDREQTIGRLRVREKFRLPSRFWKVVITQPTGQMQCAAFLLDEQFLSKNNVSTKTDPARFRCDVTQIEALTGLDFGETIRNAKPIP